MCTKSRTSCLFLYCQSAVFISKAVRRVFYDICKKLSYLWLSDQLTVAAKLQRSILTRCLWCYLSKQAEASCVESCKVHLWNTKVKIMSNVNAEINQLQGVDDESWELRELLFICFSLFKFGGTASGEEIWTILDRTRQNISFPFIF